MDTKTTTQAELTGSTNRTCLYLGIKLQPGPIQRHRLDDFSLKNTVDALKQLAGNRANLSTDALDLIHRGRILEDSTVSLASIGIRGGEMVHVVKKRGLKSAPLPTYTDTELQQIVTSLRALGCTPNAPGWTKAMQVLDEPERMEELLAAVPALEDDCMALSILHEVELLAALAASLSTMRRGAAALPSLPAALRHLSTMLKAHPPASGDSATPTSGFAYSLEALSEDEDGDEDEEEPPARGAVITQEEVAAALRAARENITTAPRRLLQMMRGPNPTPSAASQPGGSRNLITTDMFSTAVAEALNRAVSNTAPSSDVTMDHNTTASSSRGDEGVGGPEDFSAQLRHMHDMGLFDDAVNLRALLVCNGDVNAAINFVFSSMEE